MYQEHLLQRREEEFKTDKCFRCVFSVFHYRLRKYQSLELAGQITHRPKFHYLNTLNNSLSNHKFYLRVPQRQEKGGVEAHYKNNLQSDRDCPFQNRLIGLVIF